MALAWVYTGTALAMSLLAGPFVLAHAEPLIWVVMAAAHAPGFAWTYDRLHAMSFAQQLVLLFGWALVAGVLGSRIFAKRRVTDPRIRVRKAHDGR